MGFNETAPAQSSAQLRFGEESAKTVALEVATRKAELRANIRENRGSRTTYEKIAATKTLTENLLSLIKQDSMKRIACYLPTHNEPNTEPFIDALLTIGIEVILPAVRPEGTLAWIAWNGTEQTGQRGTREPQGRALDVDEIDTVDLMLIPAATVDRSGFRLGWGGGYYDRALAARKTLTSPVYSIVWDSEIIEIVPREKHDVRIDGIVTERRIISF